MPLHLYHKTVLRKIASRRLLKIDYNTDTEKRIDFCRERVTAVVKRVSGRYSIQSAMVRVRARRNGLFERKKDRSYNYRTPAIFGCGDKGRGRAARSFKRERIDVIELDLQERSEGID